MTGLRGAGRFRRWLAPLIIAVIFAGTLTPNFGPGEPIPGLCLICGHRGLADSIVNLLLFLPLGIALRWRLPRPLAAVSAAFLLSGVIEGLQFLVPGRYPTAGDLAFNTLGAALGVLLADRGQTLLHPDTAARRRLAALAALASAAVLLASGWLLQPSFPESDYFGQWTADLGHLEAYEGRVLETSVGGFPAPSRRLADPDSVRARLLAGAPVRIVFKPGPLPPGLAPIFSVFDEREREIVLYGLDDRDLVFRYRSRAVAIRLDQPDLRLRGAAAYLAPADDVGRSIEISQRTDPDRVAGPHDRTDAITMVVRLADEGICVRLSGRERACPLAHTVGRGWAFLLYPESFAPRVADAFDFLWALLLTLPIGFWGRRVRPTLMLAAPALSASLLGPWILGQIGFSIWVTVGLGAGAFLGIGTAAALRNRPEDSRSGCLHPPQ